MSSKLKLGIVSDEYTATSNLLSLGSGPSVDETVHAGQDKAGEPNLLIRT